MVQESFDDNAQNKICRAGTPLKCDQVIRLQHVNTKKYLHSHYHRAMLSGQQEVSGFGEVKNLKTSSDGSDDWKVICHYQDKDEIARYSNGHKEKFHFWERNQTVKLLHVATQKYLSFSPSNVYTESNCPNCPIVGFYEAFARDINMYSGNAVTNVFRIEDGIHLFE